MASISINCLIYPQALARQNTRKSPNKPSQFADKSLNPKSSKLHPPHVKLKSGGEARPQPVTVPGGEATTYVRLPPREDFSIPSLSLDFAAEEVKLSESDVAGADTAEDKDGYSDTENEDEEVTDDKIVGNYRVLEVFEGNSGSNDEDDEFEDEDFDIENGDDVFEYDGEEDDDEDSDDRLGINNGERVDVYEGEAEGDDDVEVKDKGVPAVMRCFDRAKIFAKAGDGGNGVVAFRREKYVPMGGPSGGDGGRGGNVYMEVDGSMNSLLPFRNSVHFRAGRGSHGLGKMMSGARGEDVVVKVAPGTIVKEAGKEEVLLELLYPGQRALLLPGGRGGRGNTSFKSSSNKVPRIAENGEEGPEL